MYLGLRNYYYLLPFIIIAFVSLFYLSTTFLSGLIICGIVLNFYIYKERINYKYFIYSLIIIVTSFIILLSDNNCSKKILDLRIKELQDKNYFTQDSINNKYNIRNITSSIYERSIKSNIYTLKNNPLGWGFGNNEIGTKIFLEDVNAGKFSFIELNLQLHVLYYLHRHCIYFMYIGKSNKNIAKT